MTLREATNGARYPMWHGIVFCGVVALVVSQLARVWPALSPLVMALFLGALCGRWPGWQAQLEPGARMAGRTLLRLSVALLGLRLGLNDITTLGWGTLAVISMTVLASLSLAWLLAKRLGLSGAFAALIGCGTAICGASAVAAVAPIVGAKESEVSFSVTLVTLFGFLGVIVLPALGLVAGMPDAMFGIWAGTALHDTAQVLAAGFAYSPEAGEVAAATKMIRITALVPVSLFFAAVFAERRETSGRGQTLGAIRSAIPAFLLAFVALVLVRSLGWAPDWTIEWGARVSQAFLVTAMVGVGFTTRFRAVAAVGWPAVAVGFASAGIAGLVSYLAITWLGIR